MVVEPTNSLDVAAAVVERLNPISALKLQKLVFYVAGEYAALTAEPLFPEDIEAWELGPVVCDLWKEYKSFDEGQREIVEPLRGDSSKLNDLAIGCVDSVLDKYGSYPGSRLVDMSHEETAWIESYVEGQKRTKIPFSALVDSFRAKEAGTVSEVLMERIFSAQSSA